MPPVQVQLPNQRYIPLVSPLTPRTYAHALRPNRFQAVAVMAWPFLQQKSALDKVVSKGLSDTIDFDGSIILSSVMPDELITERGVDWYIGVVKALRPSAAITWDVPTYVNHPRKASLSWLLEGLEGARKMAEGLDIPLIGLVSGADLEQVKLSSAGLEKLGFAMQALACREYVMARKIPHLQRSLEIAKQHSEATMMVSCSSPSLFARFPAADYFVGMGWYNKAYRGQASLGRLSAFHHFDKPGFAQLAGENLDHTLASQNERFPTLEEAYGIG